MGVGAHSLTAKALYGSNPESAARTFNVAIAVIPVITTVKDSKGNDIPDGATTIDTTLVLTGTATANLEVEIFDGPATKGRSTVNASGVWTHTLLNLADGSHRLTAKARYGSETVSAPHTVTVAKAPELIIDPTPMVLDGLKLIQDYGWPTKEVAGNVETRHPSQGTGPFTYTSADPSIASVDGDGKVSGMKRGTTRVTVTDRYNQSASYDVTVSNVYRIVQRVGHLNGWDALTWVRDQGGVEYSEVLTCMNAVPANFERIYGWYPVTPPGTYPWPNTRETWCLPSKTSHPDPDESTAWVQITPGTPLYPAREALRLVLPGNAFIRVT
ncbi:Intimin [Pseudomonas sp. AD21]|nr:Intimin [Pseudomonas sp. AD21]